MHGPRYFVNQNRLWRSCCQPHAQDQKPINECMHVCLILNIEIINCMANFMLIACPSKIRIKTIIGLTLIFDSHANIFSASPAWLVRLYSEEVRQGQKESIITLENYCILHSWPLDVPNAYCNPDLWTQCVSIVNTHNANYIIFDFKGTFISIRSFFLCKRTIRLSLSTFLKAVNVCQHCMLYILHAFYKRWSKWAWCRVQKVEFLASYRWGTSNWSLLLNQENWSKW